MNRIFLLAAALLATAVVVPTAEAKLPESECLQVYPWSRLCEGDVDGFACAATRVCAALDPELPHVDCIQVVPWSYLCSGNVKGFVDYWVDRVDPAIDPCVVAADCIEPPHVDCIQAVPWSYLCSGNVRGFVNYWLQYVDTPDLCITQGTCDPAW